MKILGILVCIVLAVNAATDLDQWLEFRQNHGKQYRSLREYQNRYAIFQQNLRKIEDHNKKYENGETTYYLAVTQFADMTHEEFISMLNTTEVYKGQVNFEVTSLEEVAAEAVPDSIDWRDRGAVGVVKSQGSCGGCWAFSAVGAMEGAYAIKTGTLLSLSEQNLIDCSSGYGNTGCTGGTNHYAFDYVRDNGIELEEDYPFLEYTDTCHHVSSKSVFRVSGYTALTYGSESVLKKAVGTVGPVAVSINADDFGLYGGGILDNSDCSQKVNHGVLVVGYGEQNGHAYWLVKNSWGSIWGENGYIKMTRDKDDQCAIATWGVYPVIA